MDSLRDIVERQLAWRRRENRQPLIGTFAPVPTPCPGRDVNASPRDIAERKRANLAAQRQVPGDSLAVARVDFGTALLPALAGAGFEDDGHTSWATPVAETASELTIRPFDLEHPLWRQVMELFVPLLEDWDWDSYLPGPTVMLGPMDILAGCLGPENLALSLHTEPDAVRQRSKEATALFLDVLDVQVRMLRDAGLEGGVADWMKTWMPGVGVCFSEDFSALCGAEHFRRFFLDPDGAITARLDSPYLHLHSGALPCLDAVLELPNLQSLELSNDPSGPPLDELIAAAQKVQARGLPLQVSNWQRPLTDEQIDLLFTSLDPRGLKVTLQAGSLDEAHALYERGRSFGG